MAPRRRASPSGANPAPAAWKTKACASTARWSRTSSSKALDVVSGLPFTMQGSARLLEIKIGLLVGIFVYAFFKFSWAIRQLNFCGIMVAAAPKTPADNDFERFAPVINSIAKITSYAGENFNSGLRAYYFALAALAWFLHPWLMI